MVKHHEIPWKTSIFLWFSYGFNEMKPKLRYEPWRRQAPVVIYTYDWSPFSSEAVKTMGKPWENGGFPWDFMVFDDPLVNCDVAMVLIAVFFCGF